MIHKCSSWNKESDQTYIKMTNRIMSTDTSNAVMPPLSQMDSLINSGKDKSVSAGYMAWSVNFWANNKY